MLFVKQNNIDTHRRVFARLFFARCIMCLPCCAYFLMKPFFFCLTNYSFFVCIVFVFISLECNVLNACKMIKRKKNYKRKSFLSFLVSLSRRVALSSFFRNIKRKQKQSTTPVVDYFLQVLLI